MTDTMTRSATGSAPAPVVSLRGVDKTYGRVAALRGVDLDLHAGEVHCLAGENGAGKSTLIKILTGAVSRDGGSYAINAVDQAVGLSPVQAREAGVGAVYQELSLLPELSVGDNMLMGRFPSKGGLLLRATGREQARAHLERVGLGGLSLDTPVGELPAATRQLVEIARVLGLDAKLVIFDEPTTALSEAEAEALLRRIGALRDEGIAVLYVTHRIEEMFAIGDQVTVLRDGRLVQTRPMAGHTPESLVELMVGRPVENLYPGARPETGEPRLEVRGLRVRGAPAPVDLTVRRGEIVGLAGLLGSGRSEFVRAVFGADPADGGEVLVDGERVPMGSPRAAARGGIGLLTEDRKESGLLPELSIRENIALAGYRNLGMRARADANVTAAAEGLTIKFANLDDPVTSLSGGNQQKVLLARWLSLGAKVLLLDEPTKGVDVGAKADIYQIVAEMAREGLSVVIVSSYLPELLGLCDRIVVVRQGRFVGDLPAGEATEEEILRLASLDGAVTAAGSTSETTTETAASAAGEE
ncbi:sugar ABC transporter ATP-binding protein [Nonomuraea jiangxiensis]|uniref:Ribose transport system ATP-binding protein/rhamnose transport system ATP-binding protein n=1 Tax=Nonomuraea jiangxiensis TaxID=633440 RepID=A0A1G8QJP1_9ACTN|nr:sugar ABC transporter ATP-binding protein [Nonomuraea jiangxiensis]SDJ05029.1 ribose transport system ATP-binding protein/rhamnose transport system ATP-binding protein [Nonomuraea jiangxiensis]